MHLTFCPIACTWVAFSFVTGWCSNTCIESGYPKEQYFEIWQSAKNCIPKVDTGKTIITLEWLLLIRGVIGHYR